MIRKILAAVDGSDRAAGVLAGALEVAERFDAKVHLFRCVVVPQEFPAAARMPVDQLAPWLEKEATSALTALAAGKPRVTVEPLDMTAPQPWRAVLAAAARLDVDLIVVGSHGYGGWDRLLGTNASRVVDHADRSVLVVHERKQP